MTPEDAAIVAHAVRMVEIYGLFEAVAHLATRWPEVDWPKLIVSDKLFRVVNPEELEAELRRWVTDAVSATAQKKEHLVIPGRKASTDAAGERP